MKHFQTVVQRYPNSPYCPLAKKKVSQIEGLASDEFAPVYRLIREGKPHQAIALLRKVRRTFSGTGAATAAERRLEELKGDPTLTEAITVAQAEDLLSDARSYLEASDLIRGLACYKKLTVQYTDTPQAKEAQQHLARLASDEKFQERLRLAQAQAGCQSLLNLARTYRANDLFETARANYQRIIDQSPDTSAGRQAAEELKELEEESQGADR